ncbi:MAG TPA: hypothetical protein VIK27_05505 [Candidatus Aquilonibacter sp.]
MLGPAVCVAAPGQIAVAAGYRDQVTIGTSRQDLIVYPAPVVLIGMAGKSELIASDLATCKLRHSSGRTIACVA